MGQFVVAFSFLVVILQATTMLLERSASTWSFYLLDAVPNLMVQNKNNNNNNSISLTASQQRCYGNSSLLSMNNESKIHNVDPWCLLQTHAPHEISSVLKEWNPHAILLTLCGIQLLMCIAKTQHSREIKSHNKNNKNDEKMESSSSFLIHFPFYYGVGLLSILLFVILLITGLKHADLVQYPTILTIAALLVGITWYAKTFDERAEDATWNLGFHMQMVSVPLAVLSIATCGARLWTDVLTHALLLSAAANCLWLQSTVEHQWSLQIIRVVTILLPTFALTLAHMQWGFADNWLYAIALMGCGGLLPLYVVTIILPQRSDELEEAAYHTKIKMRMAHLSTAGGLLSLVVNLGMLSHDI